MKKTLIFIFLVLTFLISASIIINARTPHGVIGYVQNASDGTDANGADVNFSIFRGGNNICNLTDTIGISGNSGQPNWYAQDIGNCGTEWQAGDVVYVNIVKDIYHNASTSVNLTENGSDQAPDTILSSLPVPTATAYEPSEGSTKTSNSVTFQLKCSDAVSVSTLRLYGDFSGSWALNAMNSSPINDTLWNLTETISNGIYTWAAWCNNSEGNGDWSENITFTVNNNTITPGGGGGGSSSGNIINSCGDSVCNRTIGQFNFTCYAWHETESILNMTLYGNWLGGWHESQIRRMILGMPNENISVKFTEMLYAGIYVWDCYACTASECFFVSKSNYTLNAEIIGSESWVNCCTDCGCLDGANCGNNTCEQIHTCDDGYGTCDPGENQSNCCFDCGCPANYTCSTEGCISEEEPPTCNDGYCDIRTENIINCPEDCTKKNSSGGGSVNGGDQIVASCGDKICGNGENQNNCCIDCGCSKGRSCVNNKCIKINFIWWILIIILILVVVYLIVRRNRLNKTSLMRIIINIGTEIDKKKYNEIQKNKSKGRKIDFEKQNKKIEEYINDGLKICKKVLKQTIEKEEISAVKDLVEKKKQILHETILGFEDYKKIIRKERLAFEEDIKDVLFLEEIPKYAELKKQVSGLSDTMRQIRSSVTVRVRGSGEMK
ncbi:MAG: hypothetical protein NTX24_05275 [Candidatus Pacearchaeota archaeon]|nr:hypothetical protein [Candidatus Pacearchaeota archaeon]